MANNDVLKPRTFDVTDPREWFIEFEHIAFLRKYSLKEKLIVLQTCVPSDQTKLSKLRELTADAAADDATDETFKTAYIRCKDALLKRYAGTPADRARAWIDYILEQSAIRTVDPGVAMVKMRTWYDTCTLQEKADFSDHIFREGFLATQPHRTAEWFVDDPPTDHTVLLDKVQRRARIAPSAPPKTEPVFAVHQPAAGGRPARPAVSVSRPRNPDWCWYHNKHGAKATNCRPGCTFQKSGNGPASCQ